MDLRSTQLKDTYGNLVTIGSVAGAPTTGTLQNGQGTDLTILTLGNSTATNFQFKLEDSTTTARLLLSSGDFYIDADIDGGNNRDMIFRVDGGDESMRLESNGDISFQDTSNNEAFYWDASAGSLGIGETSPASTLEVSSGTANNIAHFKSTDSVGYIAISDNATSPDLGNYIASQGNDMFFSTADSEAMRIDSSGNVGIGTDSPLGIIDASWGGYRTTEKKGLVIGADIGANTSRTANTRKIGMFASAHYDNGDEIALMRIDSGASASELKIGGTSELRGATSIEFNVASTTTAQPSPAMKIDSSGNVLIGATATPTSSAGNIVLNNGTAPTGNATNGVILYAEDVSTSSELKVRDEAGNVTTLSPHNFSLIPDGASEPMAWAYYSERDGKKINVDMLKLARMVESLTGEKLVYEQ